MVLYRKILRDLWHHKVSLISLAIIVMVGTGVFIGMGSVYLDLKEARDSYYRQYRIADFWLDAKRIPAGALPGLTDLPNVAEVRGRVNLPLLLDLPEVDKPLAGTAISLPGERHQVLMDVRLSSGRWFSDGEAKEAILNDAFAAARGLKPGDRIKALLLDRQHELLVVGLAKSPEFVYLLPPSGGLAPDPANFAAMYLPEEFLRRSSDLDGAWNQIVGRVDDADRTYINATLKLLERRLDSYGVTNTTSIHEQSSASFIRDELVGLRIASKVLPMLFLGTAVLIMNVLLGRIVAQQRIIIGTLRALGYSRSQITLHYLSYGVTLGLLGSALGALFGYWLQGVYVNLYNQFYDFPTLGAIPRPSVMLTGVILSVIFAITGALFGARKASQLQPAAAMHPPPPEKGGRIFLERVGFIWNRFSFTGKMATRSIFRHPFRSSVGIGSAVISTALVLTALSMQDALDYMMSHEFERMMHQDVTIALRDPVELEATSEVGHFPGVVQTEAQLGVVADVSFGPSARRLGIVGIPRGNNLFTPVTSGGGLLKVPPRGMILTRKLAELLGAAPGDVLTLRPLIGRREVVQAPIPRLADTYLGLAAYADLEYLSELLGENAVASSILATANGGEVPPAFLAEVKERPGVVGFSERRRALQQLQATFGETMGAMIGGMVFFAGLIAFGSILNAAIVNLGEREREVGTLRVLGYTPVQVGRIFSGESFFLGILGIIVGLGAGVGLTHLLSLAYNTELYRFPVVLFPSRFIQTAIIMLLFIAASQLIVQWMIRKLAWLEALKIKE